MMAAVVDLHEALGKFVSKSELEPQPGSIASVQAAGWGDKEDLTASERVARSMSLRFRGVEEDRKFARAVGREDDLKRGSARLDHLIQQAESKGIEVFRRKKKAVGVGVRVPSATNLIREIFGDEGAYRLTSAVAHSRPTTLAQSSFRPARVDEPLLLEKGINNASVAWLLKIGVEAVSRSTWARAQFFGRDTSALGTILEAGFYKVPIKPAPRFWREAGESSQALSPGPIPPAPAAG